MKKIAMICLIVCCSYLGAQTQDEHVTAFAVMDNFDMVTSMDALGYSDDNSIIFRMDVNSFLKRADSIFVGYDSFPHGIAFKKAIIYSKSSRIVDMYIYSVQLDNADDIPYADYISYVDGEGLVHEIFNETPKNAAILKKFSILLVAPEKFPAKMMD